MLAEQAPHLTVPRDGYKRNRASSIIIDITKVTKVTKPVIAVVPRGTNPHTAVCSHYAPSGSTLATLDCINRRLY